MKYQVIATFQNPITGVNVEPGEDFPEGIDEANITRLIEAKCLRPVAAGDLLSDTGDDDDAGTGRKAKGKK